MEQTHSHSAPDTMARTELRLGQVILNDTAVKKKDSITTRELERKPAAPTLGANDVRGVRRDAGILLNNSLTMNLSNHHFLHHEYQPYTHPTPQK